MSQTSSDLDPIAGVSLELYATIIRAVAAYNYDPAMLPGAAAQRGVDCGSWRAAHDGWNDRISRFPDVTRRFSDVFHAIS